MAGLVPAGTDRTALRTLYIANLKDAARRCADAGLDLLIEPINPRDIPGFFLNTQAEAHRIVAEVGAPNLKVQMDLYHCQIVEGDLAMRIREYLPGVGHFQIAGVPERHEPDIGEINYPYLFALLDSLGYDGWIGCEYRPRAGTSAGLGWLQPWFDAARTSDPTRDPESMQAMQESRLRSLKLVGRGKVRDNYALGDDKLLMVTTDRLSAFDVVMGEPIPQGQGAQHASRCSGSIGSPP